MRERCKAARDELAPQLRLGAATTIARLGIGFMAPRPGATVSAYRAIGSELDPAPLLARLSGAGFAVCLPVLQKRGNPLIFRGWRPGEPLVQRMWGIEEPPPSAPQVEPDILLVPLLAFDAQGWRLGYGGGFYDRTLVQLRARKAIVAIGIAYDEQRVDTVPRGPHDQRLDWLLTPGGAHKL